MTPGVSRDSWVEVPGGKVFARRWDVGATDRAPIVLMHDSLGCVELWRDFPCGTCARHRTARDCL